MIDLKDNESFVVDYGSYDDLLEDIKISGHIFFAYKDKLYFINTEDPFLALRDDPGGEIIRTFNSDEELLNARFLDGKTLKEAIDDLQFIDW